MEGEQGGVFEDDGAFQFVGEFANISGPRVAEDALDGDGSEVSCLDLVTFAQALKKRLSEREDVVASFAQGWKSEAEEVESLEEVLSEGAGVGEVLEVVLGCRDDSGIDRNGFVGTDAADLSVFDGGEHFGLEAGAEAWEFVEEERPAVRGFEQPDAGGASIGEGTAFVAEQFGFGEGFRQGGAVDLDEWLVGAWSFLVDPAGERGFSGAGFTLNEDGREVAGEATIRGQDALELGFEVGEAGAEEEGSGTDLGVAMFLDSRLLTGSPGAGDGEGKLGWLEGFDQVIQRTQLEGLDGAGDRAFGRHHDDPGSGAEHLVPKQVCPGSVRQMDVEEREIEGGPIQLGSGGRQG